MEKITIENYDKIYEYLKNRQEILQYWCHQPWLIKKPYFFDIKDGVLYIYKRIFYAHYDFLSMPPMTMDSDYLKELILMLRSGFDCVFSTEWQKKTGKKIPADETEYSEHIFKPIESLSGKQWKDWRKGDNYLKNHGCTFEFLKHDPNDPFSGTTSLIPMLAEISDIWRETKNDRAESEKDTATDSDKRMYLSSLKENPDLKNLRIMLLRKEGKIIHFNMSQRIGNTVISFWENYKEVIHGYQMRVFHYQFGQFWNNECPGIYFNRGFARTPNQKVTKERYRPILKMDLLKRRV